MFYLNDDNFPSWSLCDLNDKKLETKTLRSIKITNKAIIPISDLSYFGSRTITEDIPSEMGKYYQDWKKTKKNASIFCLLFLFNGV